MSTVKTKISLSFSNEEEQPIDFSLVSSNLGLPYNTLITFNDTPANTFKLNKNYVSLTIIESEDLILNDIIVRLTEFLTSKKEVITNSCKTLHATAALNFVLKMHDGQTPGLSFSKNFLSICSELKLEINFDMYVF